MSRKKTPTTFEDVLGAHFKRFNLGMEHRDLFLGIQETVLVRDWYKVNYGIAGLLLFNEDNYRNGFWSDLKLLGDAQKATKKGRRQFSNEKTIAMVIPSVDAEGNINPAFFLPGTPKKIIENARLLEEAILSKRNVEGIGVGVERR